MCTVPPLPTMRVLVPGTGCVTWKLFATGPGAPQAPSVKLAAAGALATPLLAVATTDTVYGPATLPVTVAVSPSGETLTDAAGPTGALPIDHA